MIRVIENLSEFVLESVPEGALVRCRVTRSRKGVDRGIREHRNRIYIQKTRQRSSLLFGGQNLLYSLPR